MASTPKNLYEYYQSKGQALPTVQARQSVAQQAGITGYTGTASQNQQLLGYLTSQPTQGTTITSESLQTATPVAVPPPAPQPQAQQDNNVTVNSLLASNQKALTTDQQKYDAGVSELTKLIETSGDQGAIEEAIYKQNKVDEKKKMSDDLTSKIEQEQKATLDAVQEAKLNTEGLSAGALSAKINDINSKSANRLANYGIALSAVNRDYATAASIAERQVTANSDRLKAKIEAQKFVLDQLGTKLATEKSTALTLQLRAIDNEQDLINNAIKLATDGAESGSIDGNTAFQAVQDLTSGKISLSQFYGEIGADNGLGIVNGYDISSYATDPQHEQKVTSIYSTIPDFQDEKGADLAIKKLSPQSPVTGKMVVSAAQEFGVDPKLMIAIMQQDSSLGTAGMGARNNNPGNIAQFDDLKQPVAGYKTMQEGVNAVAKWLSNHKSKGRYNGEFEATIDTVIDATGASEVNRKNTANVIKSAIANGDYKTAYKIVENNVSKSLTGDIKTQFDAKRVALPSIIDLEEKIKAYEDAGGKMGLLKGNYEKIYSKLGEVNDPKFKALATDLRISLQKYRKDLSGAAFSEQEARDYASVNPSGDKSVNLNLAVIAGMKDNFKRQVDKTVEEVAGEGAQYMREYAEMGTTPKTQQKQTFYSTPGGNSYVILP